MFDKTDNNGDGTISLQELNDTLRNMNQFPSEDEIKQAYNAMASGSYGKLARSHGIPLDPMDIFFNNNLLNDTIFNC